MRSFISDSLYAFRILYKRPGLTLLAVLALSISLGLSTTTFSILNGIFFKSLPFEEAKELQVVGLQRPGMAEAKPMSVPLSELGSLDRIEAFEEVFAYFGGTINISGDGNPERYDGAFVSHNFLEVLGHAPVLGRSFTKESQEAGAPGEILISHETWMERFHGDPEVIGTPVRANGAIVQIVGVLPEGFHFPMWAQAWLPLQPELLPSQYSENLHVMAVARLKDDADTATANEQLAVLFKDWDERFLEDKDELVLSCRFLGDIQMTAASRSFNILSISGVLFILLISCANVGNLLIGRSLARGREMAVRAALGATRMRTLRQLMTESLVLCLTGTIGGLLYTAWAIDLSTDREVMQAPYWMSFDMDWRVFLFAFVVMILTTLISGLIPAWQASKTDLNEMLKDTAHTSTSFRLGRITRGLAVVQIAFSCAILFGAGLVTRNVIEMNRIETGYDPAKLLTMRMGLFPEDYPTDAERNRFYSSLTEEVGALPGVEACSVTSWIGEYGNFQEPFLLARDTDAPDDLSYSYVESVSASHFSTMGMQLLGGRGFTASDMPGSPMAVVVNQTFVDSFLGEVDPVGERIHLVAEKPGRTPSTDEGWTIVGVVSDVRVSNFTSPDIPEPIIYTAARQNPSPFMTLVVRGASLPSDELQASIEQTILGLDPHLPVYFEKTMATFIEGLTKPFRMLANFLLMIGLMALFLAAIGLYGMLAFNVSRRRREIGIRMALGANTRLIIQQVLRQGIVQVTMGIGVGTLLAYLVGQVTRNFLLGINPADLSVYGGVLLILIGIAVLAFSLPARRAARLSPMEALRYE